MYTFLFSNSRSTAEIISVTRFVKSLIVKNDEWKEESPTIKKAIEQRMVEYPGENDLIIMDVLSYIINNASLKSDMADNTLNSVIESIFPEDLCEHAIEMVPVVESILRLRFGRNPDNLATIRREYALLSSVSRLAECVACRLLLNIIMYHPYNSWDDEIVNDLIIRLSSVDPVIEEQMLIFLRQV